MTLNECRQTAERRLSTLYPQGEARWLTRIIFERLKGYTQVDMAIKANDTVSEFTIGTVNKIVDRLLRHEPIQYIFGLTQFYGLTLKVTPDTLIPRPETEQLVEMIIDDAGGREDLKVLDIATGSGCIAIALARYLKFADIKAIDISEKALEVARDNARATKTAITFSRADALCLRPATTPLYDIIVSNPPYITMGEKATMDRNVTDFEPAIALFVPDNDPLMFYRAICDYAASALRSGGRMYFELNPLFAAQLSEQMKSENVWNDVQTIIDMQRNIRFLTATRRRR